MAWFRNGCLKKSSRTVLEVRPRVVIIGAGFAGLRVARGLRRTAVDVIIIDRHNHHLFQPLLYQVATAGLAAPDIAEPIRRVLRRCRNVRVIYGEVKRIDSTYNAVWVGEDKIPYDTLVLAAGATHSYFGRDDWAPFAPGLKTLEDALDIRSRVLSAFEIAEGMEDDDERSPWLHFVVVGAGPTGVELAGALVELAKKILPQDFRRVHASSTRVTLVEGSGQVLGSFPAELSKSAQAQLQRLGVQVMVNAPVTAIDEDGIVIGQSERIHAKTVVWAAGVQASPLTKQLGAPLDSAGRVFVTEDLSVPGVPRVFAIGDAAHVKHAGLQVPGTAPAAVQMGSYVAGSIQSRLKGENLRPFKFRDKGSMATIGRASAVAQLGRVHLRGLLAWTAWLLVHILFLVGFRSRIVVLVNWAWAYIAYRPAAQILPRPANAVSNQRTTPPSRTKRPE